MPIRMDCCSIDRGTFAGAMVQIKKQILPAPDARPGPARRAVSGNRLERSKIMEWIPIVFVTFKVLVLGTGMFFAVKWHYDQGRKKHGMEKPALLRASARVAAIFVLGLLAIGLVTFVLVRMLHLNLSST
jgi:hypothetical protein